MFSCTSILKHDSSTEVSFLMKSVRKNDHSMTKWVLADGVGLQVTDKVHTVYMWTVWYRVIFLIIMYVLL